MVAWIWNVYLLCVIYCYLCETPWCVFPVHRTEHHATPDCRSNLCTPNNLLIDGASTTYFLSTASKPTQPLTATTTSVIIVVAVVIILVVILVGAIILVVIFRAKKRKQQLVINKLLKASAEKEDIEIELKHERTTEKEAIPIPCQ